MLQAVHYQLLSSPDSGNQAGLPKLELEDQLHQGVSVLYHQIIRKPSSVQGAIGGIGSSSAGGGTEGLSGQATPDAESCSTDLGGAGRFLPSGALCAA